MVYFSACSSIDICFLIDPTFRIMRDWHGPRGTKEFLLKLMRKFSSDKPNVRTCAQTLNEGSRTLWRLYETPDRYNMDLKIRSFIPYSTSSVRGYSQALSQVMSQQFIQRYGDRPSSPNVLVVLASDYVQSDPTYAVTREATSLKLREIKSYVISWGRPNRLLLSELAGGDSNRMFINDVDSSPFDEVEMIYNDICNML